MSVPASHSREPRSEPGLRLDAAHDSPLLEHLVRARDCLQALQRPDGHWVGELQGDTILESEWILLMAFLGREREENPRKAARYLLQEQQPEGGWSNYPGGPADVSVSVKAYFALKLTGHSPEATYMVRAREVIHRLGGANACNSFTRFYLALLGQIPYNDCPAVPPEMIFLPTWCYFNIYAMSSWTRTIVVPLSIFYAHKPVRQLPPELGIGELFRDAGDTRSADDCTSSAPPLRFGEGAGGRGGANYPSPQPPPRSGEGEPDHPTPHPPARSGEGEPDKVPARSGERDSASVPPPGAGIFTWRNFFLTVDRILKWLDPRRSSYRDVLQGKSVLARCWTWLTQPLTALRARAVERATQWMLAHFEESDGVGAIFPPMIYTVICLRCLGYADDSPEMKYALQQLDDLMIVEGDTLRLQPCFSPVWDTALAINALAWAEQTRRTATGQAAICHPPSAMQRGIEWLLAREIRRPGDWSATVKRVEPAGWVFEYRNAFYPDTDDTAMVLMALARSGRAWECQKLKPGQPGQPYLIPPVQRGLRWLIALQNSDGGWAAFDRDINREVLTRVPFADHNAMLDPSCPDITARVLEAFGHHGFDVHDPWIIRGLRFVEKTQDPRGCWIGRWGVNYLYGTWQVLQGLRAVNYDLQQPAVRRAVAWLKSVQQECGGWGESCHSYDDPSTAGQGPPTASQTAWALLGLLAAGEEHSPEVHRGIEYLLTTQRPDGNWDEPYFTGTGFPKVFYLKYHLYRLYFPLMALARYRMLAEETGITRRHEPHRTVVEQRSVG